MKKQLLLVLCLFVFGNSLTVSAESDPIILDLSKPTVPAVIEYTEGGYWVDTYNDEDFPYLVFSPFRFSHVSDGMGWGGMSWDGFTVSVNGSTTEPADALDQWGCMAGGGIKSDADGAIEVGNEMPYLVGYWPAFMEIPGSHYMTVSFDGEYLYKPEGVYIANHPQAYYYNANGSIAKEGDYFKMIIGGIDAEGNDTEATVEHYLAKMVDGKLVQSKEWEWVDLSSLGAVKDLYVKMESTDNDPVWGINTPTYFCMDKLQVLKTEVPVTNISAPAKTNTKVYPTLFTDQLNVDSEMEIKQIQLCDLNGRVVYTVVPTNKHYTIPTGALSKGVYILKLTDGKSISVHKIIKK